MDSASVFPTLFLDNYLAFCASPLRGPETIESELITLTQIPMVKQMAFCASASPVPETLMIGLHPLIITDPESTLRHFIGNFIVYITRMRTERMWVAEFELTNLNPIERTSFNGEVMHPHMQGMDSSRLKTRVAKICIQEGRFHIYQHIRQGELHYALTLIINLLHSLGPNHAYHDIWKWPLAEGEE